jgi:hypothetical protein
MSFILPPLILLRFGDFDRDLSFERGRFLVAGFGFFVLFLFLHLFTFKPTKN